MRQFPGLSLGAVPVVLASICLLFAQPTSAQPSGYGYGRQVLIQGGKITGSTVLTDVPVLIDITNTSLRTTANGGRVQNANGYDITFTLADCSTVLKHEIESYDAVNGRLIAWVLVPSMVPASNRNLHMYYGKSGVSTNPSSNLVWAGYYGAWHFQGGSMTDNTGNGYNATNNGTTTQSPAYINDGRAANGTQWMQIGNFPDLTTSFTMSAWIYTTDNTYPGQRVFQDDENNTGGYAMSLGDPGTGSLRFYSRSSDPVSLDTPNDAILNNTWYYVTAVVDITARMKFIYINGALAASGSFNNAWGTDGGPATMAGETALGETANRFKGRVDEIRVAKTALSASRVLTEYNSQSSPSTFYTLSAEYTATQLCLTLPVELLGFDATNVDDAYVQLSWATASEHDNDHFTVERSLDGENWTEVAQVAGAGESQGLLHYDARDEDPEPGYNYYRLLQTDHDGTTTASHIQA
ncbi:MAG TPA: DUF2341 domain-containing protein, partial [Flavobacteriales bacterium]|nr:DUF2341 domain-containing protein [Flavobacteriales bacterium]